MQDKETKKTLIYMLVAGMALLVAWEPWRPAPADFSVPERVGQKLFPTFTDPLAAKSLEIVTFDEESAAVRDFRVVQTGGVWTIPSHSGYPADAKEHMARAATALMDVTVLSLVSDMQAQKTYGVITPDPEKLKVGMTGVGTRVTIRDGKEKVLADLVIGEAVKDAPQLRYVREVGRDPIYTVRLNTGEFSTKFVDWIEKDLLKLNAFDVTEVQLNDYSTRTGVTADGRQAWQIEKRSETKLDYDDAKSAWNLVEMEEFDKGGQGTQVTLGEDEELNAEKLNNMKTALDDLQIIDVERKPAGLSQDLKASEEFINNREAVASLAERGFLFGALPGEEPQIYSSEGEVMATTKDGVKYVLRFGDLAGVEATPDENPDDPDAEPKSSGPSRFLFVTPQFDASQIPKPELLPMPGEEEPQPEEEKPADDTPASEEPPAEEPKEEPPAEPEETPAEGAPTAENPAEEQTPETKTAVQDAPADTKADEPPAETPAAEEEKPEAPAEENAEADAAAASPDELKRIEVRQENKRRQDEYDAAVKRGQEKVKELNERFADWYFIISDDVYKKIHLNRADIIKQKTVESTDELGNLKQLQQGLGQPPAQPQFP